MTHRIDMGGRQGRGDPEVGHEDRPHSVWGDLATGAGLLAPDSYSEPETTDLQLGPMTQGEHLAKWLLVALVACIAMACAVVVATLPS